MAEMVLGRGGGGGFGTYSRKSAPLKAWYMRNTFNRENCIATLFLKKKKKKKHLSGDHFNGLACF